MSIAMIVATVNNTLAFVLTTNYVNALVVLFCKDAQVQEQRRENSILFGRSLITR